MSSTDGDAGISESERIVKVATRWEATLAAVGALVLYLTMDTKLQVGPSWLVPALEGALLVPLVLANPVRISNRLRYMRVVSITLIALINLVNLISLGLLVHDILNKIGGLSGRHLILSAIEIWITNVLVFALWYWELDGGGPVARTGSMRQVPDFQFPQDLSPDLAGPGWVPEFADYLYLSFTNATAFSPTDTMPLSRWAKMLMLAQASASLLTIAVVAARAVNILT